ncbi:hypothetical protein SUGI_0278720 [Cryptomeria japonica]|nr:hypothetical protein SUGI_0278720 [Cryptomeria japonica]
MSLLRFSPASRVSKAWRCKHGCGNNGTSSSFNEEVSGKHGRGWKEQQWVGLTQEDEVKRVAQGLGAEGNSTYKNLAKGLLNEVFRNTRLTVCLGAEIVDEGAKNEIQFTEMDLIGFFQGFWLSGELRKWITKCWRSILMGDV